MKGAKKKPDKNNPQKKQMYTIISIHLRGHFQSIRMKTDMINF